MATRRRLIGWLAPALVFAFSCEEARPGPSASGGGVATPQPGGPISSEGGASGTELDGSSEAGADVTGVLSQLVETIEANAVSYDPVDRADLNDVLSLALVLAESPGGRGAASAQCASDAAAVGFSDAQVATLCQDVRYDSASCASKAFGAFGFDRDSAALLCASRGGDETAECAGTLFRTLGFSQSQAVVVCGDRDGSDVEQCVRPALSAGFDREQTVALCANRGGASTAECARSANRVSAFTREQAVAVCRGRGALETATCASTAYASFGFSREQAIELCANRGQPANATCANRVRLIPGFTRGRAVAACRRPRTILVP